MMKQFMLRKLVVMMSAASVFALSQQAMASAFMLWETDAASLGNYHAGVAAIADDASTNWYNAAGLSRLRNQQIVLGVDSVHTDFRFTGTVNNHGLLVGPQSVFNQNGGNSNLVPFGHYAIPINDCWAFGLSAVVPFGLKTNYGTDTFVRYAADLTKLQVVDVSPSLSYKFNNRLSVAAGLNWQDLRAELDKTVGALLPAFDSVTHNEGTSRAYGFHVGALYQWTECTRVGISYRSKMKHHVHGTSTLSGQIANGFLGGVQKSSNFKVDATLPAHTNIGLFHTLNPCWDLLAHVSWTQWNVFNQLDLMNVAGIDPTTFEPTNSLTVVIPENYKNTWNYSVGANWHPNDKLMIRYGVGYDQTPSVNSARNLQLPDSDRIAAAIGVHYQATRCVGMDFGYNHFFGKKASINNLTQAFGPERVTTDGQVSPRADVVGVSVKWDLV